MGEFIKFIKFIMFHNNNGNPDKQKVNLWRNFN